MGSPFSLDIGTAQGRIASDYAADGSYTYELGHALNQEMRMGLGDYHQIKQDIVLDPEAKFIRVNVRIVPPSSLLSGYAWKLTLSLNGTARAIRTIEASNITRTLTDMAIPLALANTPPSTNEIKIKLELVTA